MEENKSKILDIKQLTPSVKRFRLEKPLGFEFNPGHHTGLVLGDIRKPFSIASPVDEDFLEFMIREYPERKGFTKILHGMKAGDELGLMGSGRGGIKYSGEGIFIAAGTGIVPFTSIFRTLKKKGGLGNNKLIYINRSQDEIILEDELKEMFKDNVDFILTREEKEGYGFGRLDEAFLKRFVDNLNDKFYLCGPSDFVKEIRGVLVNLGVNEENIVFEGKR